uniref:(northern house mosquito) hypothetical protein n=1 Tax=Culex pipiens TaxID=7175 RepID=A0A8D8BEY0_CULPI
MRHERSNGGREPHPGFAANSEASGSHRVHRFCGKHQPKNHRQRTVRFLRPGGRDRVRTPNLRQGHRLRVLQKGRFHCQGAQAQPAAAERTAAAHFQGRSQPAAQAQEQKGEPGRQAASAWPRSRWGKAGCAKGGQIAARQERRLPRSGCQEAGR